MLPVKFGDAVNFATERGSTPQMGAIIKHYAMLYTYTYVKGEKQLELLLKKMGKQKPVFNGCFAHADNITIEAIDEKPNEEEGYRRYFILYMLHEKGTWHQTDARKKVHEDIRNGEKGLKKI